MGDSQALVGAFGKGRVAAFGDSNGFTAMLFAREDRASEALGMNSAGYDWKQFVLNVLRWLAEQHPTEASWMPRHPEVLRILQGAPADLANAPAQREDGSDWTWDGRGTPFVSKKMDHVLHSTHLQVANARVFEPSPVSALPPKLITLSMASAAVRPLTIGCSWLSSPFSRE